MIFVTLGSQKFQFNRLLKEIDRLIEEKKIKEDVVAQIGISDYKPKHYKYFNYLTRDEFLKYINECNYVITHAGTGAIITALKNNKKVIAIPRLSKYGEHVDDHQIQLINEFRELNFIEPIYEIKELEKAISCIVTKEYNRYISNTFNIIEDIEKYLNGV